MRYLSLFWLLPTLGRLMLADTNPGGGGGGSTDNTGGTGTGGGTPPVTFTPEQQAAVDRIVEERLNRDRAARGPAAPPDLEELRRKATEHDRLVAASRTDQERAAAEALERGRTEGRTEGRRAVMPALVAAEVRAASGGSLSADRVAALTAPLAADHFLDTQGALDPTKVAAFVQAVTGQPAQGQQGGQQGQQGGGGQQGGQQGQQGQQGGQQGQQGGGGQQWPDAGQGPRGSAPASDRDAGRAEARRRFGDPAAQQGGQQGQR